MNKSHFLSVSMSAFVSGNVNTPLGGTINKLYELIEYTLFVVIVIRDDSSQYPVNALGISTSNQQYGSWIFAMDNGIFILHCTQM